MYNNFLKFPAPNEKKTEKSEKKQNSLENPKPKSDCYLFLELLFDEYPDKGFSTRDLEFKLEQNKVSYKYNTLIGILYRWKNEGIIQLNKDKKYVKVVK